MIYRANEKYFESEIWKCKQSPTGSHIEFIVFEDRKEIGTCNFCGQRKLYKRGKGGIRNNYVEYL